MRLTRFLVKLYVMHGYLGGDVGGMRLTVTSRPLEG